MEPASAPSGESNAVQNPSHSAALEPNLQIGDFRIERRLGAGGMGVVYQAMQVSLGRRVALKVLPFGLAAGSTAVQRFRREARAAARLCHPGIVTIFAEGAERDVCYFAMEMIDGRNLDRVIADLRRAGASRAAVAAGLVPEETHPWSRDDDAGACHGRLHRCRSDREYFNEVAGLISQAAEALHYAHGHGIIHRDVKPSNLMLSREGRLILLDFGIARMCEEHGMTVTASFVGTPRYMSPEQIAGGRGRPDHRCDIYSLGATLYELLTLEPLMDGDTQQRVVSQILSEKVRHPRQINRRIPIDLDTICCKAIEKDPSRRYQSAAEMAEDLRNFLKGRVIRARRPGLTDRLVKLVGRHKAVAALLCLVLAVSAAAGLIGWKHYSTRWAQQYAMAEIDNLLERNECFAALQLAERAERYIPNDPLLIDRWPRLSREHSVITTPPGARIYLREYFRTTGGWKYLGRSPLRHARIPFGTCRWKVVRPGFVTVETVQSNDPPSSPGDHLPTKSLSFTLQQADSCPSDMVWVPPSNLDQKSMFHGERLILLAPAYFIDKCEVTNGQYQEFVDAGGYEKQEFWQEEFSRNGQVLPWSQAVQEFQDQSGRFGPASWKDGAFPEGQDDYPVGGISWYEAMAYARFRGKDLPTIFHWALAARADDNPSTITSMSNFGDGPAPVGTFSGMGRFGLYDAAGNVREWCSNAMEGNKDVRCILGSAWNEHACSFSAGGDARSPWNRDPCNGLRCVLYTGGKENVPEAALAPVECRHRDLSQFTPVSDEVFASYLDTWYRYDPTELNPRIESVDEDQEHWRRERISFDATYPSERVIAYLYLPKAAQPPYQAVVWYPGDEARESPWNDQAHKREMTTILRSGRALIVPIYRGTYERRLGRIYPPDSIQSRNLYVQESQDMRRAIDYLHTRDDIDASKLAYVGLSWGAEMGSVMIATESRLQTGIFLLGGIGACERHPASDPANFAPRVRIPILMLNGRDDAIFPLETAQKPLFDLLGTPTGHKQHLIFPGGHSIAWECREQYHKAIVDWLDQYLGKVETICDAR
ncbi:MAG: SUMF1/EgtB/PvdO family nonheme iron enzyme [Phycisphaerae bacterium]|nr:SUMF1/EgtB/PvdO family nonheme iron enzyme [Phycisphaerae bacterium]